MTVDPRSLSSIRDIDEYLTAQKFNVTRPSPNLCQIIHLFPGSAAAVLIDYGKFSEFAGSAVASEFLGPLSAAQFNEIATVVSEFNSRLQLPAVIVQEEMFGVRAPIYFDAQGRLSTRALEASVRLARHGFENFRAIAKDVYRGNTRTAVPEPVPFEPPPYRATIAPIPPGPYEPNQIRDLRLTTVDDARRYLPIPGDEGKVVDGTDGFAMTLKPGDIQDMVNVRWDAELGAVRLSIVLDGRVVPEKRQALDTKIAEVGRFLFPRFVVRGDRLVLETHLFLDDDGGIRVWAVGVALSHLETALDTHRETLSSLLR